MNHRFCWFLATKSVSSVSAFLLCLTVPKSSGWARETKTRCEKKLLEISEQTIFNIDH